MQLDIGGETIAITIEEHEPPHAGTAETAPHNGYVVWHADDTAIAALIGMNEELYESLTEMVLKQLERESDDHAADIAYDNWLDSQDAYL